MNKRKVHGLPLVFNTKLKLIDKRLGVTINKRTAEYLGLEQGSLVQIQLRMIEES